MIKNPYPKRKKNRIKGYDYSRDNFYFITINVKHGMHHLGRIEGGKMVLNDRGAIVEEQWKWMLNPKSAIEIYYDLKSLQLQALARFSHWK